MAIPDDVLAGLLAGLKVDLTEAGLVRERGGLARGVAWAEASGRGPDGAWLELRLHHRPTERRMDAGLLQYEPMGRGARTLVLGERSAPYRYDAAEVVQHLADEVAAWLRTIASGPRAEHGVPAR
ncbi:MAG TPA: hypothetical protein VEQ11_10685 [Chloroflexota bacterium]|nr:hypothetical protein [Chloroflexota bacterium]